MDAKHTMPPAELWLECRCAVALSGRAEAPHLFLIPHVTFCSFSEFGLLIWGDAADFSAG